MGTPRIGIIANTNKAGARSVVEDLLDRFRRHEIPALLETRTAGLVESKAGLDVMDLVDEIDLILLLGGDGTILHLASALGPKVKPIASINIGTLGFMTMATTEDLDKVVEMIRHEEFEISYRAVMAASLFRDEKLETTCYAMNEVVFGRGPVSRVVRVEAHLDGEYLTRYSGDGLIVATPTGSTAYSLSAGGPIIEPGSRVFVLTPVCNHSLSSRPLLVSDESLIEIMAPEQRDDVFMTVDGQTVRRINGGCRMEIRRADYRVPLVRQPGTSFFAVLRNKLEWGER